MNTDDLEDDFPESEAYGPDPDELVLQWLAHRPGWHSPREIRGDLKLWKSIWQDTIRRLVRCGVVERSGHGPNTSYRLVSEKCLQLTLSGETGDEGLGACRA